MPGGSGKKRPWSSASWPRGESSRSVSVLLNAQRTTPEPTAPPAEEVEVLDEELLVGRDFTNSNGLVGSPESLGGHSCDVRRLDDDVVPALVVPALPDGPASSAFSRSLASKLTCCGTSMPARHVLAHAKSITLRAASISNGSNRRRMGAVKF